MKLFSIIKKGNCKMQPDQNIIISSYQLGEEVWSYQYSKLRSMVNNNSKDLVMNPSETIKRTLDGRILHILFH